MCVYYSIRIRIRIRIRRMNYSNNIFRRYLTYYQDSFVYYITILMIRILVINSELLTYNYQFIICN